MKITEIGRTTKGLVITFDKKDAVYCTKEYISDGHFLIKRTEMAELRIGYKFASDQATAAFHRGEDFSNIAGNFKVGAEAFMPEMKQMFNGAKDAVNVMTDLYCRLVSEGEWISAAFEVTALRAEAKDIRIVDLRYLPLMKYGTAMVGPNQEDPIFITDSVGDVVIAVMAQRMDNLAEALDQLRMIDRPLNRLASDHGGAWGEHPDYASSDWRAEVISNDTRLGYWDWAASKIEQAGNEVIS